MTQTQSFLSFGDPMDYSPQAPLSMGFPRQEYQSELPFYSCLLKPSMLFKHIYLL